MVSLAVLCSALLAAWTPESPPEAPERPGSYVVVDAGAREPAVSPDASRIAVSLLGSIFVLPAEGGEALQVSDGSGWDAHPAWSPDGRLLVWARSHPRGASIVAFDVARATTRTVHRATLGIGRIAFHPGGEELFFVLERSPSDQRVWRVPAGGGRATVVVETENAHERSFALSPDGSFMLAESGRYGATDLYLVHLDSQRPLAELVARTPAKEHQVAWGPDGSWVYLSQEDGVDRLMVRSAGGGAPREVFRSPYDQKNLALTPDGSAAVITMGRRLARVDLGTGEVSPLPFRARVPVPDRSPGDLVVTGARIFTGRGDEYLADGTVVVEGGRIRYVGSGPPSHFPDGVPVLEAGGRVLMAGLLDNHWHFWAPFVGRPLLERGVTAIRDPGVGIATAASYREAIALGLLEGPTIHTTGPLIDGPGGYQSHVDVALTRAEAAEPLVAALHAQGVDALKVYFMLEPAVLRAVVEAAGRYELPVTGHLGVRTSWRDALDAGIAGFNHLRVWRDLLPPEVQPSGEDGSLDGALAPIARMQSDWSDIDPDGEDAGALLSRMAEQGVALDATLGIQRVGPAFRRTLSAAQLRVAQESYGRMERFLLRAHEAGVTLLAGTDNGSIYDELEAYQAAGIPNAEILRAATVNGAAWLGVEEEFGTVEVGRRADLILVDGDPLTDVRALRGVRVVVQNGRVVVRR